MKPRFWVIIPAAGVGSRMQTDIPKQYLKLGGQCVLDHSVQAFMSHSRFDKVYVGVSPEDSWFAKTDCAKDVRIKRFFGGQERSDTVLKGLDAIGEIAQPNDWVWVHDAARPCLSLEDLDLLVAFVDKRDRADADTEKAAVAESLSGALLAAPVVDTIKETADGKTVLNSVDRSRLWRALTPQVFRYQTLKAALTTCASSAAPVTDEASAIETIGGCPELIYGDEGNIKITRPNDLSVAENTLIQTGRIVREPKVGNMMPRIGTGYDVHAFCEGDEVTLGGVKIPFSKAFIAHSDGDVLLHAIMDAMLGALALGDIGKHFPDTDSRWKGANSRDLLKAVNALILERGYKVGNLDSIIIAQAPKMAPHIESMQANIAKDLGVEPGFVGVKATTSEKLGFTGREEGVACQASVMLMPCSSNEG